MKKINRYLIVAVLAISLYSCEDAYQVPAGDEIVDENAITTVDDVESAVIGAYSGMAGIQNSVEFTATLTDEVNIAPTNNGQGIQVHNWSINSGTDDVDGLYTGLYLPISRANRALAALPKIIAKDAAEQTRLDRSKAELLFIRAYFHFELLRYFAPSYTDPNALAIAYVDYVAVLQKPVRNTVGEVYAKLDEELTGALALMPAGDNSNVKVTRDAITGLQARIALYKGDYATAISLATPLIAKYPLVASSAFPNIWADASSDEVIFKLRRIGTDSRIGNIFIDLAQTVYYNPSNKLIALYDPTDVRLSTYISADGSIVTKYPGASGNQGLSDVKLIRVAELLLIRSEAYAKSNQLPLASADYNTLRKARQTNFAGITFSSTANGVNEIMDESFREFAFEGTRFFDLKRNAKAIERNAADCATQTNGICTLPADDHRFALPIPSSEIFVDKNMVQNPGY